MPFHVAQRLAQPALCVPGFPGACESSKLLFLLRQVPFLLGCLYRAAAPYPLKAQLFKAVLPREERIRGLPCVCYP